MYEDAHGTLLPETEAARPQAAPAAWLSAPYDGTGLADHARGCSQSWLDWGRGTVSELQAAHRDMAAQDPAHAAYVAGLCRDAQGEARAARRALVWLTERDFAPDAIGRADKTMGRW